ncbi:hypothetical protein JG687_00002931 [Phytophthora cactorum]|uniref:WW domain-containing protein n=2 Tax=Phytophthora cactorum TaxID=29920 RepID=A0A8T1USZ8_9STRA|nr:hypothetical protein Pcac1_g6040 [Phytophthora cactorum]KAG3069549.1 hypothetical protein PC122_g16533 [Phytophthora cactorum]KAG3082466.1 hypothetical protein PC121_g6103 [Phytophthora cactorum]KAG6969882.1 hypothetical protein JG687_00002931 [Phytophthora cactorum]
MFLQPRQTQTELHGYAVEFSPFVDNLVAVGTAQYFGIVGNGRQHVYEMLPAGGLAPIRAFDTPQGVYDCAWSENHGQQLVSSCADGSVKLWHLQTRDQFPIQNYHEHKQEVSGVNWNLVSKDSFASASWDGTVKIWKPEVPHSVLTLAEHSSAVYNAVWNTQNNSLVASCSGDGTVKIWDLSSARSVTTIAAHGNEVLALDWNKYNHFEVVSGSADCSIKVWDVRNPIREVRMLPGHSYAVKRIKCSPHDPDVIASVSYDMSVGVWNTKSPYPRLQNAQHHSEFAFGFDFSLFVDGLVASCSWDRQLTGEMVAPKKTGFWTEHMDSKSGRTYYFNMALGRSYWELPSELQAQVKKPALDALREWDPEAAERKYGAASQNSGGDDVEIRRKREEALAKSRTEAKEAQAASTKLSLEERMSLAAQKRKAAEMQSSAGGHRQLTSSENSNEYLEMVRQLQQNDESEEGAGGKWLVR